MSDTALDAVHQRLIPGHTEFSSPLRVYIVLIKPIMQADRLENRSHSPSQGLIRTAV